jgi:hypothetical protein
MVVHLALWASALAFMPLALPGLALTPKGSTRRTLTLFALGVGLPFAFLSANAPLISRGPQRSGGPSAGSYSYGASNQGR